MALSEARKRANAKYIAKAYDSVSVRWPIEFCDRLRAAAAKSDESLAGYIRKAIEYRMEQDDTTATTTD